MSEIQIYQIALIISLITTLILIIFLISLRAKFKALNAQKDELENINIEQRVRLENDGERLSEFKEKERNLSAKIEQENIKNDNLEAKISDLTSQISALKSTLNEREKSQKAQDENLNLVKQNLSAEFANLANKIFDLKVQNFTQNSQNTLDLVLKPLKEQIECFQTRINEVHSEATKGNASLEAEIKKVLEVGLGMSKEAQNLTSALKGNNKIAGGWGETQLETTLQAAGLIAGEHYQAQASFVDDENRRFVPDFIIKLPENKHIIIDSKISLLAYDEAIMAASNSDDKGAKSALNRHVGSLKTHINELAKKDYSSLNKGASPDFVLMFVPIEPAFIEAMKVDKELFNYGFKQRVVMVSHTTLMPILRTIANLWRVDLGNKQATQIINQATDIYNTLCLVIERFKTLGNSLNKANASFNDSVTALVGNRGLLGKVEKFKQLSNKANQNTPQLSEISVNLELNRLN